MVALRPGWAPSTCRSSPADDTTHHDTTEERIMMFWDGNGLGGWGYALMTISMVLFWALLIAGVVALIRATGRDNRGSVGQVAQSPGPEEVLAQRYARGEIDQDEYHQRLDVLRGRPAPLRKT
jgi:putative membrane protein